MVNHLQKKYGFQALCFPQSQNHGQVEIKVEPTVKMSIVELTII